MTELAELLKRHRPILRYDSQEVYFADSAAEWTDNPQNLLRGPAGRTIAAARPSGAQAQLSLEFLCRRTYPDGSKPQAEDRIGDSTRNYVQQARLLHAEARYANRMYGRWARGGGGSTWLQYWFFYFYNDYNLVGDLFAAGLHEGDWEMIQLRLGASETPDLAVYAQHARTVARPWGEVETRGERPVVYVARGSHASYFTRGAHWTGHWFDHADGKGASPDVALEPVHGDPRYAWLLWPGYWGDTKPTGDPLDSSSPTSPSRHRQWGDPDVLLAKERMLQAVARPAPAPAPTPRVELARVGDTLHVAYSTPAPSDGWQPARLVVTVDSPEDPLPPTTRSLEIGKPSGKVDTGIPARDDWHYEAHVSVASADGLASASAGATLPGASP
jgi:hypothetical protein